MSNMREPLAEMLPDGRYGNWNEALTDEQYQLCVKAAYDNVEAPSMARSLAEAAYAAGRASQEDERQKWRDQLRELVAELAQKDERIKTAEARVAELEGFLTMAYAALRKP